MSIAYWCVLIAACFPYIFTTLAKAGPGFNNRTPREYLARVEGWRKRAHWVQLNSFEAFPAFAAAVIIAHLTSNNQNMIDSLAMIFIGTRILYSIFYIADLSILRSLAWFLGFAMVIGLFISHLFNLL